MRIEDPNQYLDDIEELDAELRLEELEKLEQLELNEEIWEDAEDPYNAIRRLRRATRLQQRLLDFQEAYCADPMQPSAIEIEVDDAFSPSGNLAAEPRASEHESLERASTPVEPFSLRKVMQEVMEERRQAGVKRGWQEVESGEDAQGSQKDQEDECEDQEDQEDEREDQEGQEDECENQEDECEDQEDLDGAELEPDETETCDRVDQYFANIEQQSQAQNKKRKLAGKQTVPVLPQQPSRKLHHYAASRGVSATAFFRMMMIGLPLTILNALVFVNTMEPFSPATGIHAVEMYSGAGRIAATFQQHGANAGLFDTNRHHIFENILLPEGLLTAIKLTRNSAGGFSSWATKCSSWIYLVRASSGRSALEPLGDTTKEWVRKANTMVARNVLLMAMASCLLVSWLHEQPKSSCMSVTKFADWLRFVLTTVLHNVTEWTEAFTWLGAYGHETMKPTELLGSHRWIERLARTIPAEHKLLFESSDLVQHLPAAAHSGHRRISGAMDGLTTSQVYPWEYAKAVHAHYTTFRAYQAAQVGEPEVDDDLEMPWEAYKIASARCNWAESRLDELDALLALPADKLLH